VEVKTRSFRVDVETQIKLNEITKKYFEGKQDGELNFSDIVRFCIDFTHGGIGKQILDHEEVMYLVRGYATVGHLTVNKSVDLLDNLLYGIERANEEYFPKEIKEIYALFNEEEPITLGKLLRFQNREMPEFFLEKLGVDSDEYETLNDVELVDFILEKFSNQQFKENAKSLFRIEV
jgi:hypothetical protein